MFEKGGTNLPRKVVLEIQDDKQSIQSTLLISPTMEVDAALLRPDFEASPLLCESGTE